MMITFLPMSRERWSGVKKPGSARVKMLFKNQAIKKHIVLRAMVCIMSLACMVERSQKAPLARYFPDIQRRLYSPALRRGLIEALFPLL